MILTGKAKEDFNKWNYDNDFGYIDHEPTSLVVHFEDLDEFLRNTIIIEWFDSVGIYIEIYCSRILGDKFLCIVDTEANYNLTSYQDSRQEATTEALIKANEMYNLKDF